MASEKRLDMTAQAAIATAEQELSTSRYILECTRSPGMMAIHDKRCKWLSVIVALAKQATKADAVEVVRCQNCVHAEPLDRNCELSTSFYMHCKLWRGEETKNVWHKYKKYYKDYSLVERDGYCDSGAKMDGGNENGG